MPNKMEQIAAMFGKKLNEEFCVKYCDKMYTVKFVMTGIEQCNKKVLWNKQNCLMKVLTGEAEIVDDK